MTPAPHEHHHGTPKGDTGQIDPVCGMTVKETTPHHTRHGDREVLFCSVGRKAKFVAEPDKYLAPKPEASSIDPVCGMTVKATTQDRVMHGDREVLFCSAGCKTKFVADPEKYLTPAPAPKMEAPKPTGGGVEYTCPMHPEIVRDAPGSCPICGMALEPRMPTLEAGLDHELVDMTRRFRIAAAFTIPLFAIAMGEMVGVAILSGRTRVSRALARSRGRRWGTSNRICSSRSSTTRPACRSPRACSTPSRSG